MDISIVKRLINHQFPKWAHLPISPFTSSGTGHAVYQLGNRMYVRLPLTAKTALQMEKELIWLPKLAPQLPLAIPMPLGSGQPDAKFPFRWAIYTWIDGKNATQEAIADEIQAARDLSKFIRALHNIDSTGGPGPGEHNFFRGVPLADRNVDIECAIKQSTTLIDTDPIITIWKDSLTAPHWSGNPVWIHGDIHSGNLIAAKGRIVGVIDFGGLAVGDPACDLLVAWWLLTSKSREVFRRELEIDNATWRRGRGWALSMAITALPYYIQSNPSFAEVAKRTINEIVNDFSSQEPTNQAK